MAGITDYAFRKLCKEFGAGLVCTEMISSRAIFHDDTKTKKLLKTSKEEKPLSVQIFGSDTQSMGYATEYVSKIADIIDINMGCPAPKIIKNGDGSKLLQDINKASEIIKEIVKKSKRPVTLKIRKGWDENHVVAVDYAQMAEQMGISAITIHGRTRSEYYSGKADLEIIKKLKQAVKIPVIGNGDIVDEESALKMFERTGVDGIMIGRGSFGNPWIFKKILYYIQTGEKLEKIEPKEKLEVIKKHIEYEMQEKPEIVAIRELRKQISWYTKNLKNSSEFRNEINKIENKEELIKKIEEYFKSIDNFWVKA